MPTPDVDPLILGTLRSPMLTELMNSQLMKAELGAVAHEVMRRWVAKFPKETGRAASTAKVTYHRRRTVYDNRWEAEFSAGGPRAPYVVDVEAEQHILAQVLRDMGYNVGDIRRVAPPSRSSARSVDERVAEQRARPDQPVQKQASEQQDRTLSGFGTQRSDRVEAILRQSDALNAPGRRIGSRARDRDYRALQAAMTDIGDEPGAAEARSQVNISLSTYRLLRQERGLPGEPD